MQRTTKGLAYIALLALSLSGCGTLSTEFNYAGDASETALLEVPEPLRVRSLDGKEVKLPLILKYPYTVTLTTGPHTVGIQYGETWGEGQANELVRAPIMALNFDARGGERYQVDFLRPESVSNYDLAEDYIAKFRTWLIDGDGQQVEARSTGDLGGLFGKLGSVVSSVNNSDVKPVSGPVQNDPGSVPAGRLQSLKQHWQLASEDEKKAFMQWIVAPGS